MLRYVFGIDNKQDIQREIRERSIRNELNSEMQQNRLIQDQNRTLASYNREISNYEKKLHALQLQAIELCEKKQSLLHTSNHRHESKHLQESPPFLNQTTTTKQHPFVKLTLREYDEKIHSLAEQIISIQKKKHLIEKKRSTFNQVSTHTRNLYEHEKLVNMLPRTLSSYNPRGTCHPQNRSVKNFNSHEQIAQRVHQMTNQKMKMDVEQDLIADCLEDAFDDEEEEEMAPSKEKLNQTPASKLAHQWELEVSYGGSGYYPNQDSVQESTTHSTNLLKMQLPSTPGIETFNDVQTAPSIYQTRTRLKQNSPSDVQNWSSVTELPLDTSLLQQITDSQERSQSNLSLDLDDRILEKRLSNLINK